MYLLYRVEPRQPMGPARTLDQVLLLAEAAGPGRFRSLRGRRRAEASLFRDQTRGRDAHSRPESGGQPGGRPEWYPHAGLSARAASRGDSS